MNTEIQNLKTQLHLAEKSYLDSVEQEDYETAHLLAEKLQLLTRQIILCKEQEQNEKKS